MSHENTAWLGSAGIAASPHMAKRMTDTPNLPTWLTNSLIVLASGVLLALACASAWLSYRAQVAYVQAHNGNLSSEANVWALLLDTGTAGVSLLRLYETLRRRVSIATRLSLLGCIAASVTMNLLHTPSQTAGGLLVAAVPPVMYAVFLEHLLTNLRGLFLVDEERISLWRTVALWINFPTLMWGRWRASLRQSAQGMPGALVEEQDVPAVESVVCAVGAAAAEKRSSDTEESANIPPRRSRRPRGPGPKRIAFEEALADQVRAGDLRLFSSNERERNAAAYEVADSMSEPLSHGAARRYVVQALPQLDRTGAAGETTDPEAASDRRIRGEDQDLRE